MIVLKRIKYKNFLSYGNNWTEFDFKIGINRLTGQNGNGKSCIIDALYFVLFGKSYRNIKLEQLVNSINNSDLLVELDLNINKDEYKIVRGLKPKIFLIYKNNELIPSSSHKKDYQQILEEILHITSNIFDQTAVKSITKNISFISLSKNEKRMIIESILGLEIFSKMHQKCKEKCNLLETNIKEQKLLIKNKNLLLQQEQENLEKLKLLKQKIDNENQKKIEECKNEILEYEKEIKIANEKLIKIQSIKEYKQKLEKKISDLEIQIKNLNDTNIELISKKNVSISKIELFNTSCKGCKKIEKIIENENIDGLNDNINKNEINIKNIQNEIKEFQIELSKTEKIILNEKYILQEISKAQNKVSLLNTQINSESIEIQIDETKFKKLLSENLELKNRYNASNIELKHLEITKSLLSDDGIKSFIIARQLSILNKILNTYLQKFNSEILFYFDSEFNEIIGSRYKEKFSYFNFSEGQKRRIDLAILFTFIEFSKLRNKNSNTNILILDEITSMLDGIGENGLFDILKEIVRKEQKCIITISHSDKIDSDKIDFHYNIDMIRGFSQIKEII